MEKVRQEKKHVYLDLGGANPASFDFSASTKQEAEAIFNKIQESKQKSRLTSPSSSTASITPPPAIPSIRDSVVSTSTYQTAQSHEDPIEEEPVHYEEEVQHIPEQPICEGRWAVAMYDFVAETEEELSIQENDELWILDYVSSEEWWRAQRGDQVGIVPASYIRVCINTLNDLRLTFDYFVQSTPTI